MSAFALDLGVPYPTVLADGTRTYLAGDPAAGFEQAGVWQSGLVDQHRSLLATVSESGTLSPVTRYDPYGAARPGSSVPAVASQ